MKDVVIASACRTAIGTFGGTLKNMHAATIASVTMQEAMKRAGIVPEMIEDVRCPQCGAGRGLDGWRSRPHHGGHHQ
jgi:acetyl-CoA C-acetyltransferase